LFPTKEGKSPCPSMNRPATARRRSPSELDPGRHTGGPALQAQHKAAVCKRDRTAQAKQWRTAYTGWYHPVSGALNGCVETVWNSQRADRAGHPQAQLHVPGSRYPADVEGIHLIMRLI
jgi:hypothetical protein